MAAVIVQGTVVPALGTTVVIPAHAVGDLIIIFAYRNNVATAPTKPAAGGTVPTWNDIQTPAANTNAARTCWAIATASNHTSGTWTSAVYTEAIVFRNVHPTAPIGGSASSTGTGTAAISAPAVTQQDTSGDAMLVQCYGAATMGSGGWSAVPANYTRIQSATNGGSSYGVCINHKTVSTTDGAISQSKGSATGANLGIQFEIKPSPPSGSLYPPKRLNYGALLQL